MNSLFVAIPVPLPIKKTIERLCYGLPDASWIEPSNCYIILAPFGSIDGTTKLDIQEKLKNIKWCPPFLIKLSSIGYSKNALWINAAPSEWLVLLKKTIDAAMEDLPFEHARKPFAPQIPLAHFEKMDPAKLGDYLYANKDFETLPFAVENLLLVESQITQRQRKISIEHAKFPLG